MIHLAPSLLSADFAKLEQEIQAVERAGAQYLHLDIMDGNFVPNITFGAPVVKCLRPVSNMIFDVHMMITKPELFAQRFVEAGADIVNFHYEATDHPKDLIEKIKNMGVKAGITLRPNTSLHALDGMLADLDLILIMSVEPGFGGQKLIPHTLEKIRELKRLKQENGYHYEIEIDGGVTLENIPMVLEAGAEAIVAGSSVFGAPDIVKATKDFLSVFDAFEKS